MVKRVLSVILAVMLMLGTVSVSVSAEGMTVYLSVSQYGELAEGKNGELMGAVPVELTGAEANLDDVFRMAHELYYPDGGEGYASSEGSYGFSMDCLWGDTSYNFGYQVNGEMAFDLSHAITDGDFIDAYIYDWETQSYSKFDENVKEAFVEEPVELTLQYVTGYENDGYVFSPCEGATIWVNGEETECVTDEEGKVSVVFTEEGKMVVSAKKKDGNVSVITAPVCVVNVAVNGEEDPALDLLHGIAKEYAKCDWEDLDDNLPWVVADLAIYDNLFADREDILTEEIREEVIDLLVEMAEDAERPGDLAKLILAFRALGYDPSKICSGDFTYIDLVERLIDLVEEEDDSITNVYTLPYVMMALEEYAKDRMLSALIVEALDSEGSWMSTSFGTDGIPPMILALSPYYFDEDVEEAIDEAIDILKEEQREDGLIDALEGYEAASTGLALCAFSAMGIDGAEVTNGGEDMVSGLLSTANYDLTALPNAFATEQGFRGLLSRMLMEEGKRIYDFSEYPADALNLTATTYCPVIFEVSPGKADVEISGETALDDNIFDLPAGEYDYTVSASGYYDEEDSFTITEEEAEGRIPVRISVTLEEKSSGGSGSGNKGSSSSSRPSVIVPSQSVQTTQTPVVSSNSGFTKDTFPDVSEGDWFYPSVQYVYEKNLFKGTDIGFQPSGLMTRAMLVTVMHRLAGSSGVQGGNAFTDVPEGMWYTDGIKWAAENGIVNGMTETEFWPDYNITRQQLAVILYRYAEKNGYNVTADAPLSFADADKVSDYAVSAMQYVVSAGIMQGRPENLIAPSDSVTRAEVATVLMRFAQMGR